VFFEQFDEGKAELVFVTNHRVNPKQVETVRNVGVTILHLDELVQYMIDNIEGAMPRTTDLVLEDITQVLSPPRTETSIATSLVFARLVDFIDYMKDDPHQLLFSRNIRLDLEKTDVNEEIAETFTHHPNEFAYSNNGITMLCERHTHASGTGKLTVVNPRVVNGAQTLHSVQRASKRPLSARVMVKIIEIAPPRANSFEDDLAKRKEVISKIALRTNRQNTIQKSDLVANDEKQHEIATYFRRQGLYYERRKNEWNIRKISLQSVGIDKGPSLKSLMQLGACYFWAAMGPAKARSGVKSLFDDESYETITSLSPQTFYRLYVIQERLLSAAYRVAYMTSARNRELRKYVNFAMLSLLLRVLDQVGVDVARVATLMFLEEATVKQWDVLVKALFKMIDEHFRETARAERSNGTLTIVNYSKNASFMSGLLKRKTSPAVLSSVKGIVK
jgi:AIPR protein